MELKLEVGKEYVVTHKRKRTFRAKLLDVVSAPPGDKEDEKFLTFEIDTSKESGTEWLARVRGVAKTVTNIRPSLVTNIQLSSRSPKLPEVERPKPSKKRSFLDRFRR